MESQVVTGIISISGKGENNKFLSLYSWVLSIEWKSCNTPSST